MNWRDAYEQKIQVWKFWNTETGKRYAEGFVRDVTNKGRYAQAAVFEQLAETQSVSMLMADPIFVSEEMVALAEAAAETFVPEALADTDLITPAGFAYLERPLLLRDVNGRTTSIRALTWAPCISGYRSSGEYNDPGILLASYSSWDDEDDYSRKWKDEIGANPFPQYPLTLSHAFPWRFGETLDAYVDDTMAERLKNGSGEPIPREQFLASQEMSWRTFQAFLRLMVQKITTVNRQRVDRAARRRSQRAGLPSEQEFVNVITLRRHSPPSDEPETREVEWSHRWIVGGHWRDQWYPSLGRHRQIWISPYVKGPEDKELRIKEIRAYELTR